ncbi:unnamed protein product [Protopolystoma xenopodis]|uniref:Uncharacterized protein n=1 Tax=Protopolystoma xenopodis TaxID=117903 RepID=A0A3S5B146_9PLAT|nr:unnamed protein product [Protopolystoma xenopodis]
MLNEDKPVASGIIWLSDGQFHRGRIDIFHVDVPFPMSPKPISRLDVGHDNSGVAPGWFLEQVWKRKLDTGSSSWQDGEPRTSSSKRRSPHSAEIRFWFTVRPFQAVFEANFFSEMQSQIVVNCSLIGIEQTFVCNQWLSKDEGDHLIERSLVEDVSQRKIRQKSKRSTNTHWYIVIQSSLFTINRGTV